MQKRTFYGIFLSWMLLTCCLLGGCAETVVTGPIPEPPQSDKLRFYFKVISSGPLNDGWRSDEQKNEAKTLPLLFNILDASGFSELISGTALGTVMTSSPPSWWWLADELSQARQVGKALHADYGILLEQHSRSVATVRYVLVNIHTGATFEVQSVPLSGSGTEQSDQETIKKVWKSLYRQACKDLFQSALRKGQGTRLPEAVVPLVETAKGEVFSAPDRAPVDRQTLAVYDFVADETMRTASIILADALREELLKQGRVLLVDRQRISQVLQGMVIKQMGLTDDSRAINVGKLLPSSQIVIGHLDAKDGSLVLQIKRVEIKSRITRFVGATRCPKGREGMLFDELPALARDIVLGL